MDSNNVPPTSFGATSTEDSSRALLEQIMSRFPAMAAQASNLNSGVSTGSHPGSQPSMAMLDHGAPADPLGMVPSGFNLQPFSSSTTAPNVEPAVLNGASSGQLPAAVQDAMQRASMSPADHPIAYGHLQESLKQLHLDQSELRRFSFAKQIGRDTPSPQATKQPGSASHLFYKPAELPSRTSGSARAIDPIAIRADFPALHQSINGHQLVWFDNAATTHKPQAVIDAMSSFYAHDYSNIHRAAHTLAARATDHYESARETVREFIHAGSVNDIVFVRGTTEGINFIANVLKPFLHEGDEILLSEMEHHANIVPWQMIARETRARIRVIPVDDNGELMMDEYRRLLSLRTKVVSVTHASNTLGTILPVEEIGALARRYGAKFVIDGAQSVAHLPIDVSALDCDFFVFSGHKVYAPTGIGAVYIRPELQDLLPPWQGGGNMIHRVTFDETTYAPPPNKFEAGTPSIGDAVGLEAALRYLRQFDIQSVAAYEHSLLEHAFSELQMIEGITTIGHAAQRTGLVSFTVDGFTTEQVGRELDRHGIAVRTGHHCAQPSLRHFGLESTVRPSFAIYNTHDEIDRMIQVIRGLRRRR